MAVCPLLLHMKSLCHVGFRYKPGEREVVGATRLELVTSAVSRQRSNQLSYAPMQQVPLYLNGGAGGVKHKKTVFAALSPVLTYAVTPG